MGLGKRRSERQSELWVAAERLSHGPRNAFYDRLNELLAEVGFDRRLEQACEPYYSGVGRRSIPPGVYFRMLFIGYFEDIPSQRGIAWRCEDSRSLARFLGYGPGDSTPDHSSLTRIRQRLPTEIHDLAFELVLEAAARHGLIDGKTLGVDATDLEANASMKSIVRRETGDDWNDYLRKLYEEETGDDDPSDEDLRRFDRRRKKKVSNEDWVSETDEDARIGRMKDGRTHLKYKAENALDLNTEIIFAAEVYHGHRGDTWTIEDTVNAALTHLRESGSAARVEEVVADKGYHSEAVIQTLEEESGLRTYIPERRQAARRRWTKKPAGRREAFHRNRRRVRGERGRALQRLRSERTERAFAHLCDTGGARRSWLRGLENVRKRYKTAAAAHNLGRIMRKLVGAGKPRHWAAFAQALLHAQAAALGLLHALTSSLLRFTRPSEAKHRAARISDSNYEPPPSVRLNPVFSTGC